MDEDLWEGIAVMESTGVLSQFKTPYCAIAFGQHRERIAKNPEARYDRKSILLKTSFRIQLDVD